MSQVAGSHLVADRRPVRIDLAPAVRTVASSATLGAVLVIAACAVIRAGWAMQAACALGLVMLPGAALLSLAHVRPASLAMRLAATAVTGVIALMGSGLALSVAGPHLGIGRPLSRPCIGWTLGSITVAATLASLRSGRDPIRHLFDGVTMRWRRLWPTTLPLAAIVGAGRLNGGNGAALAILVAIAGMAVLLGALLWSFARPMSDDVVALALFCVVLSFGLASSLRGDHLFGWDIQQEHGSVLSTLAAGRWTKPVAGDAYGAMASITVLPAMLSIFSGIASHDVLRWIFPPFIALVPVATWTLARRRASTAAALGVTLLLVAFQAPTLRTFTAITRQEIGLALFAVGLAVGFDDTIEISRRRWVVALASIGLAVSHYSSAYVACIVLVGTFVVRRLVAGRGSGATSVVTLSVVVVAVVSAIGWNVVVTGTGENVSSVQTGLTDKGLNLLPGAADKGLVAGWLQGTAVAPITVHGYETVVQQRVDDSLTWLHPDPLSSSPAFILQPATVAVDPGIAPGLAGVWTMASSVTAETVIALSLVCGGGAIAIAVRRRRRATRAGRAARAVSSPDAAEARGPGAEFADPDPSFVELAGAATAVLLVVVALRTSGTIANLYNPERAAVQAGIVFAAPAAMLVQHLVQRWRALVPCLVIGVCITALTGSGVMPIVLGGGLPAALSDHGEDVERFAVSDAEIGTVEWMAAALPDHAIVQTDRYGKLAVLNVLPRTTFALVDLVVPIAIDRSSWVYGSQPNTVLHHARGAESGRSALFAWPAPYLHQTKSVVYSTEVTDVSG